MSVEAHRTFAESAVPLNWYEVAKLMHESAQALHALPSGTVTHYDGQRTRQRRSTNRPVFLLAAFALENLIKAFLVYENPEYIAGGKLSRELRNNHKLSELQQQCKTTPSPKRTLHVFQTLEVGVNSWARYPCSTSINGQSEELAVTPEFWAAYNAVFDLYSRRLEKLLSKRWRGPYGEESHVVFQGPPVGVPRSGTPPRAP